MNLAEVRSIYLIGIGGIGMSALARYFRHKGCVIYGYDKTATPLTRQLEAEGMSITFQESDKDLPQVDLVIYTPAIPKANLQLNYYLDNSFPLKKRSEILGLLSENAFTIAVAGSHGKTTVTSMIAHLLKASGVDCTAFLGGIATNYQSNFIPGNDKVMVVEADEYDRSFLQLSPNIAVITAIDTDHLDVYGSEEKITEAFNLFVEKIQESGSLIIHQEARPKISVEDVRIITYSINDNSCDCSVNHMSIENGTYKFDVQGKFPAEEMALKMGGRHNVENALAALSVASMMKVGDNDLRKALVEFKGIKRRFEYIYKDNEHIYIDDYAHHPNEVKALLESVRELYPGKRITSVFQPHLYSRTNDLYREFAQALSLSDEVMLLDIYPAREEPIPGVTSELIYQELNVDKRALITKEEMIHLLRERMPRVLLTIGAGDIDTMIEPIKTLLVNAECDGIEAEKNIK